MRAHVYGTSTSPNGHSSVYSILLGRGALQLLHLYGKFLNTGHPFLCFGPRDCGCYCPWCFIPRISRCVRRGEGGMVPLQPHRTGAALTLGLDNPGVTFLGDRWPSWETHGIPGKYMAFLGAPGGTNVTLQTLLFPKLTKLSW